MKLEQLGLLPPKRSRNLSNLQPCVEMFLDESSLAAGHLDMRDSAGHVHGVSGQLADHVERADEIGSRLLGAAHERFEPSGSHEHIVV